MTFLTDMRISFYKSFKKTSQKGSLLSVQYRVSNRYAEDPHIATLKSGYTVRFYLSPLFIAGCESTVKEKLLFKKFSKTPLLKRY